MKQILVVLASIGVSVGAAHAFDPFNSAAMKKIEFSNERLDLSGPYPRIVFEATNNSGQDFSMIAVECHARANGKVIANAEGAIMNLADSETSVTDVIFIGAVRELLEADTASCRATMGM